MNHFLGLLIDSSCIVSMCLVLVYGLILIGVSIYTGIFGENL